MSNDKIKVLELFGGIGSPRAALNNIKVPYEIVDYVEIDPYVVKSYNALYNEDYPCQDVSKWNKDVEVDLIVHGSPCQDFSLVGSRKGGVEGTGTQSSLMWDTVRIVEDLQPKVVVWENVKSVLHRNHIKTFNKYLARMEELGYVNHYEVLNSVDFGIPQRRDRVFVVSIYKSGEDYEFPKGRELTTYVQDYLEENVIDKYTLSETMLKYMTTDYASHKRRIKFEKNKVKPDGKDLARTITTREGDVIDSTFIELNNNPLTVRRLTPRECWRLMGFSDEYFNKAREVNSDHRLYIQAGNSIVVPIMEDILMSIIPYLKEG